MIISFPFIHVTLFSLVGKYQRFGGLFPPDFTVSLTRRPKSSEIIHFMLFGFFCRKNQRIRVCVWFSLFSYTLGERKTEADAKPTVYILVAIGRQDLLPAPCLEPPQNQKNNFGWKN